MSQQISLSESTLIQPSGAPHAAMLPDGDIAVVGPTSTRRLCAVVMLFADAVGLTVPLLAIGLMTANAVFPAPFWVGAVVILCVNAIYGLYPGDRLHAQETLRRRVLSTSLGLVILPVMYLIAAPDMPQLSLMAAMALLLGVILQVPARHITRSILHRAGLWGTAATFIAPHEMRDTLEHFFQSHWRYGLRPEAGGGRIAVLAEMPDTTTAAELRRQYDEVIVLADMPHLRVSGLHPAGVGGAIGLKVGESGTPGYETLKRLIDVAISVPALLTAAPLLLLAALAIRIVDPGPVFYTQVREGLRGRTVRVLKLRTMYRDAEARLQVLLRDDPEARAEWDSHFKLRNDPRLLPWIGQFLRASSIDELPQFINVLRGEMSIVGPRPFPEYHLAAMPVAFRIKRATVAPGITGLWQITSRSDADLAQQQQLDEHYIDNRSVWFDLQIILGTLPALLLRKGAY